MRCAGYEGNRLIDLAIRTRCAITTIASNVHTTFRNTLGSALPLRHSACQRHSGSGDRNGGLVEETVLPKFPLLVPNHVGSWVIAKMDNRSIGSAGAFPCERYSNLDPADARIGLGFEALALCGCGPLTYEVLRNRRLSLEARERARVLVETGPAAILRVNANGLIELANQAASASSSAQWPFDWRAGCCFPAGTPQRGASRRRPPVWGLDAMSGRSRQRRGFFR